MPHYSSIHEGQVLDWHFKVQHTPNYDVHVFRIGELLVGQIFTSGRHKNKKSWSAVSHFPCALCPVNGFRTRLDAAEFLLKVFRKVHADE